MALTQTQVSQLYVAIFNRASEGSGNAFWQAQSDAATAAGAMLATDDAQEYFGDSLNSDQAFIEHIYLNTLNKTIEDDAEGIAFWVNQLEGGASRGEVVAGLVEAIESYGPDGENYDADDAATVAAYNQFTNRVEVSNYMADEVTNAPVNYAQRTAFDQDLVVTDDPATVTSAKAAVDVLAEEEDVVPPVDGDEFFLTADQDILEGTVDNDQFYADVVQVGGPQVNSLATGDRIDAGAGTDTLEAQITTGLFMGNTNMPIQPRIKDVEEIKLEALNNDMYDEIDDNDGGGFVEKPGVNSEVFFNAKSTYGVDDIWSWYSDANLIVQDLNTMTAEGDHDVARNTADMTIGMGYTNSEDTRWEASDMHVYFDQDFLLTGQESASQAIYFLLDQDADLFDTDDDGDGTTDLLANINANGLRFTVDEGVVRTISFDSALLESNDVITHADFVEALQPALAQAIADGFLPADTTLYLDPTVTDFTFLDDGSRSSDIPAIVLETQTSAVLRSVGFQWVSDLVGEYNVYGRLESEAETQDEPLGVQVALEKVGRGGDGGELIIGSMDKYHNGIDEFYVTVYGDDASDLGNGRDSSLSRLDSTGNELDKIFITSDNTGFPGDTYADLTIGNGLFADNPVNDGMDLIQSNGFMGDLSLGTSDATRVQDLATLNTTDMAGDTTFWAEVDVRDLFDYQTGSGDDIVDVDLDGDAVDTIFTGLSIMTNAGDDIVLVDDLSQDPQTGVSQQTMFELHNLSINTGIGLDTVVVENNFRFNIHAGADSDFVYVDSTDNTGAIGTWVISTATGPATFVDRVLYNAKLTVSFAGFESTVSVETDATGNFIADQLTINAAIRAAIDSNPELALLLSYTVEGPADPADLNGTAAQQLIITSTVDGINELAIDLYQPELVVAGGATVAGQINLATADITSLLTGIIATDAATNSLTDPLTYVNANDGSLNADGTVGTAATWNGEAVNLANDFLDTASGADAVGATNVNFSIINMGNGANDLVVFDSNDDSGNILVINDTFGKVSVVNFFDDAARTVVGDHALDYTHYLSNQTDATVNTPANNLSAVPVLITLDTTLDPTVAATIDANEVKMIRLVETATETFDGLTADALVTALNGDGTATDNYANINNAIVAAATTANLVGNVQNHIFMVENANNPGEYKVFHLTSTIDSTTLTTDGDFDTTAVQLGTLDFGASINFGLVGSAAWDAAYNARLVAADAGAVVVVDTYNVFDAKLADAAGTLLPGAYNVTDTADALAAEVGVDSVLDFAFDITALDAATIAQAFSLFAESNTGATTVNVTDTALAIVNGQATAAEAGTVDATTAALNVFQAATLEALVTAGTGNTATYTIGDSEANLTAVTDWTLYSNATAVDSTDSDAFAMTVAEFADFVATGLASTAGDTITIDGSAAAAGVTVDASGQLAFFNITGSDFVDTLTGGDAADTITGGIGVDTLTGNGAADTFVFASGDTGITLATADTIADFTTADDFLQIGFAGATAAAIADGTALIDEAALIAAADVVFTAGAAANDDVYAVYNFNGSGNGYVLVDNDDSGSFDAGDTIIELTGVALIGDIALANFTV